MHHGGPRAWCENMSRAYPSAPADISNRGLAVVHHTQPLFPPTIEQEPFTVYIDPSPHRTCRTHRVLVTLHHTDCWPAQINIPTPFRLAPSNQAYSSKSITPSAHIQPASTRQTPWPKCFHRPCNPPARLRCCTPALPQPTPSRHSLSNIHIRHDWYRHPEACTTHRRTATEARPPLRCNHTRFRQRHIYGRKVGQVRYPQWPRMDRGRLGISRHRPRHPPTLHRGRRPKMTR